MLVVCNIEMGDKEKSAYVDYLEKKYNRKLSSLSITVDGDEVELDYNFVPVKVERIRRITGYLVGTMDNWNNAKSAEERDRVTHMKVEPATEMETL